jgi:hypothetical protein
MPYTPDWEPLSAAVKRIVTREVDEDKAKANLCSAIAENRIRIRVTPEYSSGVYHRENVRVPPHLAAADLIWQDSRPIAPWWIGPVLGQHYNWDGENKRIKLVEVSIADVVDFLASTDDLAGNESPLLEEDGEAVSHSEVSRVAGKRSGIVRRAKRAWAAHAMELARDAYQEDPGASNSKIADEISACWKLESHEAPGHRTLEEYVSELRENGGLPQRTRSVRKRTG